MLQWSQQLSVLIPEMDDQHKQWVELINRLDQAICDGTGNDVLDGMVADVLAFAHKHFRDEEALMDRTGFPDTAAHKVLHKAFLDQVDALDRGAGLKSFKTTQFLKMLQGWLVQHVTVHDKRYGVHINPA